MQESRLQESHKILFNDLLKIAKKILIDVLFVRSCRNFEKTMHDSYKVYIQLVVFPEWCELSLTLSPLPLSSFFYCLQYVKWKGSPGRLYYMHRDVM